MFLSDETLTLLFNLNVSGPTLASILRSIERDAIGAGVIQSHSLVLAGVANCAEAGLDPHRALVAMRATEAAFAPPARYVRRVPADWPEIRARIFARDGSVCAYCGAVEGPFHIDHVHPLRRGGSHDDDNLCVACEPCNLSKKDSTVEEWRARS